MELINKRLGPATRKGVFLTALTFVILSGFFATGGDMNIQKLRETFSYHKDGHLLRKESKAFNAKILEKTNHLDSKGYRVTWFNGKVEREHRLIFAMHEGYLPEIVDHIDRDKSNNKIENLRAATKSQNNVNSRIKSNNKSGVKGVYFCKSTNMWRARISFNGKTNEIGRFNDLQRAKEARVEAEKSIFGDFATT